MAFFRLSIGLSNYQRFDSLDNSLHTVIELVILSVILISGAEKDLYVMA